MRSTEILKKVFLEINDTEPFSSNYFIAQAKSLGLSQRAVNNGVVANFLHKNAVQLPDSKRMWTKNKDFDNQLTKDRKIEEAIMLLKSEGYKIMKPVIDYINI